MYGRNVSATSGLDGPGVAQESGKAEDDSGLSSTELSRLSSFIAQKWYIGHWPMLFIDFRNSYM